MVGRSDPRTRAGNEMTGASGASRRVGPSGAPAQFSVIGRG